MNRVLVHSPFMFALDLPISLTFSTIPLLQCHLSFQPNIPKIFFLLSQSITQTGSYPLPSQSNCPWPMLLFISSPVFSQVKSLGEEYSQPNTRRQSVSTRYLSVTPNLTANWLGPEHSQTVLPLRKPMASMSPLQWCLLSSYLISQLHGTHKPLPPSYAS